MAISLAVQTHNEPLEREARALLKKILDAINLRDNTGSSGGEV